MLYLFICFIFVSCIFCSLTPPLFAYLHSCLLPCYVPICFPFYFCNVFYSIKNQIVLTFQFDWTIRLGHLEYKLGFFFLQFIRLGLWKLCKKYNLIFLFIFYQIVRHTFFFLVLIWITAPLPTWEMLAIGKVGLGSIILEKGFIWATLNHALIQIFKLTQLIPVGYHLSLTDLHLFTYIEKLCHNILLFHKDVWNHSSDCCKEFQILVYLQEFSSCHFKLK